MSGLMALIRYTEHDFKPDRELRNIINKIYELCKEKAPLSVINDEYNKAEISFNTNKRDLWNKSFVYNLFISKPSFNDLVYYDFFINKFDNIHKFVYIIENEYRNPGRESKQILDNILKKTNSKLMGFGCGAVEDYYETLIERSSVPVHFVINNDLEYFNVNILFYYTHLHFVQDYRKMKDLMIFLIYKYEKFNIDEFFYGMYKYDLKMSIKLCEKTQKKLIKKYYDQYYNIIWFNKKMNTDVTKYIYETFLDSDDLKLKNKYY